MATALPLVATLLMPVSAAAQTEQQSDNAIAEALQPSTDLAMPDADALVRSFLAVRNGLDEWEAPAAADLASAGAARVNLYIRGRSVGSSTTGVDRTGGAIAEAAHLAMVEAERTLLPRRDAMWREQIRTLSGDIMLSLEVAGPMTPFSPTELANPASVLRPGIDGVAARVGDEWALVFPSEQALAGTTPEVELPALAAELLDDPLLGLELVRDLASEHSVAFYRFETRQLVGVGEDGVPRFLVRGGSVVEPRDITVASLVGFAEEMLTHLERREVGGGLRLGLAGTIHPMRGVAEPPLATPTQQALVSLALIHLRDTPQVSEDVAQRAHALAARVLGDLHAVEEVEVAPADDGIAMAIVWVALARLGAEAREAHDLEELWADAESMMVRHVEAEPLEPSGSVSDAVLAWALAERWSHTGLDGERAESDLDAVLRSARPGSLAGQLPWVGWAALELQPEGDLAAAPAFRQIREQVWLHQLSEDDTGTAERDLAGGIIFTRGFVALPTWSATRPLAFLSTMLADERLTARDERPMEAVRLLASMRFLRQLSARAVEAHAYPDSERSVGGVRAAPWDHSMPPDATAMTLLSVTEFLRALAAAEGAD